MPRKIRLPQPLVITSIAGPPNRTIVVTSRGTTLDDQQTFPGNGCPAHWLQERW
jgi:hypothetical protein